MRFAASGVVYAISKITIEKRGEIVVNDNSSKTVIPNAMKEWVFS